MDFAKQTLEKIKLESLISYLDNTVYLVAFLIAPLWCWLCSLLPWVWSVIVLLKAFDGLLLDLS